MARSRKMKLNKSVKSAKRRSSGWMLTKQPKRMNSNTKRRNWKKFAHPLSPRCIKVLVVPEVCQVVCQEECPAVCQVVCPVVVCPAVTTVPKVDQLSKKLINLRIKINKFFFETKILKKSRNYVTPAY